MHPHLRNGGAPTILLKNTPNLAKNSTFCFFWLRHQRVWGKGVFLPRELIVQHRTIIVSEFFWKKLRWAEIWGPNLSPLGKRKSKIWGRDPKKGATNCLPKIFNNSFGLKFWRRLWFFYQTWPNSIRWLSYGILCHAQIALSPQNKYH